MRKLLFLLAFVTAVNISTAQSLGLGVKAGANFNKISGQAFSDGYELGYHVGAFAEIGLGKKLGFQPELLLNQVNTKKASGTNAALTSWQDNTSSIQLKYLTVPLLLRYKLTNSLALNLGPQFGILMSQDKSVLQNGKEAVNSGDFSLVGGLTLNFSSLRVFGRYNVGLSNINHVQNSESWKTQQLQIGVGYKIL